MRRFGKGTTIQQNILALRILTALGIKIRIGFIMFDPLMKDISELKENLDFLARTDAIMNPLNIKNYTYESSCNSQYATIFQERRNKWDI